MVTSTEHVPPEHGHSHKAGEQRKRARERSRMVGMGEMEEGVDGEEGRVRGFVLQVLSSLIYDVATKCAHKGDVVGFRPLLERDIS